MKKLIRNTCALAILLPFVLLLPITIYTDYAFVCTNTGSQMGYRSIFGLKTNRWYMESALETFMKAKHPEELQHHWVSYAGTGHGIGFVSHAHGKPGPILFIAGPILDSYVAKLSDLDRLQLYHLFANADASAVEAKAKEIEQDWVDRKN